MWNEQDHPRDDDGKFTFKNGGNSHKESTAETLFRDSRIQKEVETQELKRKNELLDILGINATVADKLYGTEKSLKKKIEDIKSGKQVFEVQNSVNKYARPVEGKIISNFGPRKSPIPGASSNHKGVDMRAPIGTPVRTITGGKVTVAQSGIKGYGTAVYIDHGMINGKKVVSIYGHLSKCDVKVGDIVKPGQVVAKSGNSGVSEGPHLHVTILENGKEVDPRKYF